MVVGGKVLQDGSWKNSDKAYAISLNPSVEVPRCLQDMCDYEHYVTYPAMAVFQDGLPTVCGGLDYGSGTHFRNCYKYNFTNSAAIGVWDEAGSLPQWNTDSWTYGRNFDFKAKKKRG